MRQTVPGILSMPPSIPTGIVAHKAQASNGERSSHAHETNRLRETLMLTQLRCLSGYFRRSFPVHEDMVAFNGKR